jgi:hypothetical protein
MDMPPVTALEASPVFPAARRAWDWASGIDSRGVLLALAVAALVVHASAFSGWLIDDAGISFAYARSFAHGEGLVSQPGATPVEGYSNPLWTLLLAPFFAAGAFDPLWTPKLLSLALLAGAVVVLAHRGAVGSRPVWLAVLPAVLLALDTSFVVWGVSGLENPLLAFLLVASAALSLRDAEADVPRFEGQAGLVAALLAMTRPDAVLYAAAYPAVLILARRRPRLARYVLSFGAPFATFLFFRRVYFGDWVPNTFYAKVRPWMLGIDLSRLTELAESAIGVFAIPALLLVLVAAVVALRRGGAARRVPVLAVYLGVAGASFVLMPPDWMPEYRFATGFFIFFYWALAESLGWLWAVGPPRLARAVVIAAAALVVAASVRVHAARTTEFSRDPTVPFSRIEEFAQGYNGLSAALGPGQHSLLTPDLGGMLFDSTLRIHDLVGLCDRTVAKTLLGHPDVFREYVLANLRPTFIHVHGNWSGTAGLHGDDRFGRDYAVVYEQWTRPEDAEKEDNEPWVGDYVRRDALAVPADLERLRGEFHRLGLDRPLP